jgi:hypothetical protein
MQSVVLLCERRCTIYVYKHVKTYGKEGGPQVTVISRGSCMQLCLYSNVYFSLSLKIHLTDILKVLKSVNKYVCKRMIDYLLYFTSRARFFHLYGDVIITDEGLQNSGLWSALRAFEQGGIFIVQHLLWHGTSVFQVSSEELPHSAASYDTRGGVEDLF